MTVYFAFEQSDCFESDGCEFAAEVTGELQLVLGPGDGAADYAIYVAQLSEE